MTGKSISAKEMAEKYNLTYQTINHYTNLGLFDVITKKRNIRFYDEEQVKDRLVKIEQMKNAGFSLRLICKAIYDEINTKPFLNQNSR